MTYSQNPQPDFQVLFESAPGLYLVLTPDFTIVAVSDAYLQATMTKREEILGRGVFDVFPSNPDDPTANGTVNLPTSLLSVLQNKAKHRIAVQKYDIRSPELEGGGFEQRYWSVVNSPVLGTDGKVSYIIHHVEDVTEFIRLKQQEAKEHELAVSLQERTQQMEAEIYLRSQKLQEVNRQLQAANVELTNARDEADKAQQRITDILESITDGFVAVDRDWRFNYVSQATTRVLQKSLPELLGKQVWQEVFPEAVGSVLESELHRAMESQVTVEIEQFYPPLNKWFEIHAYPCEIGLSIHFRDITKRKQAQSDRQQANQQIVNILESIGDAFIAMDREWRITYVNQETARLNGKQPEEFIGKTHWEVWPWSVNTVVEQNYRRAFAEQVAVHFEVLYEPLDIWLDVHAYPSPNSLSVFFRDISERKRVEEVIRTSEERFQLLLENVKDYAIFFLDTENRYTRWSLGAERILGYQEAEILGQYGSIIFTPEDLQRQDHLKELEKAAKEGRAENERWHVRKDGSLFWGSGIVTPLRDHRGNLKGFAKIMRDFTDRKLAEDERKQLLEREQQARAQAETANRIKDEFLAVLSHELRSPLNPILGWTKLLRSRKFDQKTAERALEIIDRNANLQAQLIEDLLDVSRILRGKLTLKASPVNLAATIEAAIETVRLAAEAKSIHIQTIFPPSVVLVAGDSNRLQQVVWNLLTNAVKFTPEGGRVEIKLECVESQAQIQVTDTGKGISRDFLPHVFDYFRQENSSTTRTFGGLGLGLAIVHHLVELHGGSVGVESLGEGQGATFTVRLPLIKSNPQTNEPYQQPNRALDLSGIKILVVDDETDSREFISFVLEQAGAVVTAVGSAREALEAIVQIKPNLLLSDIGMPDVDGFMLIREIRAMSPQRGIPAIALTAYASEIDAEKALSAGFQRHISKPVDPDELAAAVISLVKGSE
ncbi:PAS/PAC sensor hybrid histidine kinase [Crinalium epipsammum PCC 9333]|uniref:Circadian input-output histidine kinase CikA n=1 Tax=Crinalium epipsammum PCC 9333 TaxID=1173022 RepID=K9VZF7_9CYAN|nr:PAS domain-containing protein [Crinalium epipsammum]AFZ12929.1 PAS/PAC sensor hybrid histidine kinase [Crinalium epipsammum PCC 9333]